MTTIDKGLVTITLTPFQYKSIFGNLDKIDGSEALDTLVRCMNTPTCKSEDETMCESLSEVLKEMTSLWQSLRTFRQTCEEYVLCTG